jgi:hypothetical protein
MHRIATEADYHAGRFHVISYSDISNQEAG